LEVRFGNAYLMEKYRYLNALSEFERKAGTENVTADFLDSAFNVSLSLHLFLSNPLLNYCLNTLLIIDVFSKKRHLLVQKLEETKRSCMVKKNDILFLLEQREYNHNLPSEVRANHLLISKLL
jgi:hypothetical protein